MRTDIRISYGEKGEGTLMKGARILIIEDDPAVTEVISLRLQEDGYETISTRSGNEALELFRSEEPDLVILDLMLPDTDGISICREIRQESNIPIIIVTGRGDKMDRVVGLEVGADDYVVKPFIMDELRARIRANLRRVQDYAETAEDQRYVEFGQITLDMHSHDVTVRGEDVNLTPTEFRILHVLVEAEGSVVSVEDIFEKVWGRSRDNQSLIETHIYNLRRKIEEDPSSPKIILTIRDAGYRFNVDAV